jgi:hypothetical protein
MDKQTVVRKTFKHQLKPTPEQERAMAWWRGSGAAAATSTTPPFRNVG